VNDTPSVRERRLAHELRQLRAAVPLHGKDVAERLGWSASKVSRIETGRIGITAGDLDRLLELYAVPDEHAAYLRRLAPSVRPRGWWDAYADTLSAGYANLIRMESGSRALRCYAAVVPHALLQTPEYVRSVVLSTWEPPSSAEVERRVLVCRRRQEVLDGRRAGGPLRLSAVIDEAVLHRRPAGSEGDALLRGQLQRLLELAALPQVTLQVLPFDAGIPPVTSGSFSVLESAAGGGPDVVYLENKTRIVFIDAEGEVHRYHRAFDLLAGTALDPTDSRRLVEQALDRL
jgi:transcriptional regulator with XRE-family HTH domain